MPSWKKVITSGSAASLSSLQTTGNISGSVTSTGSFGRLIIDGGVDRVGIGTKTPTVNLDMPIGGGRARFGNGTVGVASNVDVIANGGYTNAFGVWDDNSLSVPRFVVERTGKVGVGHDPTYGLLSVNGDINTQNIVSYNNRNFTMDINSSAKSDITMKNSDAKKFELAISGSLYLERGANLANITASGHVYAGGNISSSMSSTASFGALGVGTGSVNGVFVATTGGEWNRTLEYPFQFINMDSHNDQGMGLLIQAGANQNASKIFTARDYDGNDVFSIGGGGAGLQISGSVTSTGSFGHVMQDGKGLPPQFTTGGSIFIGENAGASDDGSNNRNIGIGKNALDAATTGQLNVAIGDDALTDVETGNYNVAIGFESQKDTTGGQNTSVGYNSLEFNTSGNNNVAIGYAAAGGSSYSGISNIAVGYSSLGGNNVSGDYNVAIGHFALSKNTTADDNLAIGDFALANIETIGRNVAIGSEALRWIQDGGGGYNNTALGWNAGRNYTGDSGLVTASYGVFIGHTTEAKENNSVNEIVIGSQVTGKGSNTATIGDAGITDVYLSSDGGATVHTGNVSGSAVSTGSFGVYGNNFIPSQDNTHDLGSSTHRWSNIYSADLNLSNEETDGNDVDGTTGNWTLQEGEDDIYLINNKTKKKFKIMLQEVD